MFGFVLSLYCILIFYKICFGILIVFIFILIIMYNSIKKIIYFSLYLFNEWMKNKNKTKQNKTNKQTNKQTKKKKKKKIYIYIYKAFHYENIKL